MKTVSLKNGLLHVETPLGVINIRVGLVDSTGRRVDSVTVTPDEIIGDKKIIRRGYYNTRMIELKGVRI
jgi:hypothetical protein